VSTPLPTTTDPTIVTVHRDYPDVLNTVDPYWLDNTIVKAQLQVAERVPARYADATVTEPAVANWVRTLVTEAVAAHDRGPLLRVHTGPSLLLMGPTGTGKTHQAYGAIRAMVGTGVACRWEFAAAADLYAQLRPRHGVDTEAELRRFATAPLLVLDDLGAAKNSEWTEEINYRLVNHRYEHQLPTLLTSNVPPKNLGAELGERVASRLVEMTERVVLTGDDRRRKPDIPAVLAIPGTAKA